MGDEHLSTIPGTKSDEVIKSSVEDLVPIPSESKGISDDICDVPFCDNDHFDAEFRLIDSLLSRDISITSPKIDFLPEEFVGELDLIDPILPGINEDDFDIEALNLTPSIPFVLEYLSSFPIPVVDSDFLIEEVDTFLVSEDSIPPGIESDFDSEGDIIFLDDLLNDDPIPEYERFTFDIKPDTAVINNFDKLNKDECFDPGGVLVWGEESIDLIIPATVVLTERILDEKTKNKPKEDKTGHEIEECVKSQGRRCRNYVPWSSRLLRYAKSRPNGKLIYNSIMNGPYVRRMIPEPGDADHHSSRLPEGTSMLLLIVVKLAPGEILVTRAKQMMKGSDIGIQEKKAKLFNEWERFTSTDGESIESYYHHFSKINDDFKRNKHFPEKILVISNCLKPGMNMGQDRQMRMVGANGGNQFRQYAGQKRWVSKRKFTKQKSKWEGNVVAARAEGNATGNNGGGTVDQHPATVEETRAYFESLYNNLALEVEKKAPKFVQDFKFLAKEADESLAKYKALEL
ncbi:hypothetical protein Tco_0034237 [Tanacetum coccineum]